MQLRHSKIGQLRDAVDVCGGMHVDVEYGRWHLAMLIIVIVAYVKVPQHCLCDRWIDLLKNDDALARFFEASVARLSEGRGLRADDDLVDMPLPAAALDDQVGVLGIVERPTYLAVSGATATPVCGDVLLEGRMQSRMALHGPESPHT